MADIELVIKIPEEIYKASQIIDVKYKDTIQIPLEVIAKGTPLPKGHGRLIDEWKINKCEQAGLIIKNGNIVRCLVTDAPTIIEADKENKE